MTSENFQSRIKLQNQWTCDSISIEKDVFMTYQLQSLKQNMVFLGWQEKRGEN